MKQTMLSALGDNCPRYEGRGNMSTPIGRADIRCDVCLCLADIPADEVIKTIAAKVLDAPLPDNLWRPATLVTTDEENSHA